MGFFLILLLGSCSDKEGLIPEPEVMGKKAERIVPAAESHAVKGCLRIKMKEEPADLSAVRKLFPNLSILSLKRSFPYCGKFEERTRAAGLHLWYDVFFDPNLPLSKAADKLAVSDAVRYVEFLRKPAPTGDVCPFNDPMFGEQWNFYNPGNESGYYLAGSDINLLEAWNINTGNKKVIVGVVDSGIDYGHEDLAANMWRNESELNGKAGEDDDHNGYTDDVYGYNFTVVNSQYSGILMPDNHGTHVAGIIGAVNNNGLGVCGIAGGNGTDRGVSLMSCQIIDNSGNGADVAAAMKYAADNGAVICQNSWGFSDDPDAFPEHIREAIDYFIQYAGMDEHGVQTGPMAGGIVIFAAGNEDSDKNAIAMYDKVLSVAALGAAYQRAAYSNFGTWVDLSAPGGTGGYMPASIKSTFVGNVYGKMKGTSMACPHVSGVAALVVSQFGQEGFTNDMLWDILTHGVTDIEPYNPAYKGLLGSGLINAYRCLDQNGPLPPDPVDLIWTSALANFITLKWLIPADPDGGKAFAHNLYYSTRSMEDLDIEHLPDDVQMISVPSGVLKAGDTLTTVLDGLEFNTRYYFRVLAYDNLNKRSALSREVSQTTLSNTDPVFKPHDGSSITVKAFDTKQLAFDLYDPDGHAVQLDCTPGSDAFSYVYEDNVVTVTVKGPAAPAGSYVAVLSADDGFGGVGTQTVNYTIEPNREPYLLKSPNDMVFNAKKETASLNLTEYFADDDGEPLNYTTSISSSYDIVTTGFSGETLTLTAAFFGTATLSVTATDALGASCKMEFRVLLRDGSQEVDIFPVPFTDAVTVRMGESLNLNLKVYTLSGAKIFETQKDMSPFDPIEIDTSTWGAGSYTFVITSAEKTITRTAVKW